MEHNLFQKFHHSACPVLLATCTLHLQGPDNYPPFAVLSALPGVKNFIHPLHCTATLHTAPQTANFSPRRYASPGLTIYLSKALEMNSLLRHSQVRLTEGTNAWGTQISATPTCNTPALGRAKTLTSHHPCQYSSLSSR